LLLNFKQNKMKKVILSAIAMLAFGFVNAQDNVIKVNPIALIGSGTDLVSFEHKLGDKSSASIGLGAGGYSFGGSKYSSFGGELQYRYYFEEALKGWYAGGQIAYSAGKVTVDNFGFSSNTNLETKFTTLQIGAKGGYQWVFGSGFALDLNLGIAYTKFAYTDNTNSVFSGLSGSGVLPTFGFGLGYAF
jgi:Protein of unknown function (DUF3575)